MAKPLGAKSILIREAIKAHPKKGNTEIAELINDSHDRMDDKIKVTPQDIAQQKQAMKKGGGSVAAAPEPEVPTRAKPGRPKGSGGRPKKAVTAATPARAAAAASSPVDLIDRTFSLANECGGFEQLKKLVDRLAGV
jgi:hypothetical protein